MSSIDRNATRPRIWTWTFINLIFISLAVTGIVDVLQAALPIYIGQQGGSASLGGLTVTVFSAAALLPLLISGILADKFGCRKVMIGGGFVLLTGMAGPLFTDSIGWLLVWRILQGIGFAVFNVTSAAGAANVLPVERLGEGVGYFGVGQSLAMALGPMCGLFLIADGNAKFMWQVMAAVAVAVLLASMVCFCDRPVATKAESAVIEPPAWYERIIELRAILPAVLILIYCVGFCALIVFVGKYALQQDFGNAGPFFMLAAAGMLAVRFASGRFMDKYPARLLQWPAIGLAIIAYLILAYAQNKWMFFSGGVFFGLSFGVALPLLAALAVKRTPKTRWGVANATFYFCVSLGFGLGALLGGLAIDFCGFKNAFLLGIITAVLPGIIGEIYLRKANAECVIEH